MTEPAERPRNPGPTWGYAFLVGAQRFTPQWLLRPGLMLGTWVAVAVMPVQRGHSRAFLSHLFGRPARLIEVWRHFFAYVEFLMLRLSIAVGGSTRYSLTSENAEGFETLMRSGEPALFGTFHFGHSDLLGFALAARGRRVAMIRLRVDNSADTGMLEQQFGGAVQFIWVNDPDNLLFALKSAIERGESIAMQCDRLFTAKTESFEFLGARRLFPFTIYHLALLFDRPVMFTFGLPNGSGATSVLPEPLFRADRTASREENLRRARLHFQGVLARLETLVRQHPTQWFNFLPLNPESEPTGEQPKTKD